MGRFYLLSTCAPCIYVYRFGLVFFSKLPSPTDVHTVHSTASWFCLRGMGSGIGIWKVRTELCALPLFFFCIGWPPGFVLMVRGRDGEAYAMGVFFLSFSLSPSRSLDLYAPRPPLRSPAPFYTLAVARLSLLRTEAEVTVVSSEEGKWRAYLVSQERGKLGSMDDGILR